MNRFKRHRARTSDPLLAGSTFSTRQVTAMVVAILVAVVLVPVGAQAAQVVSAIITDSGGTNQAHVDANGNLQVKGSVTVADSVADPGRHAVEFGVGANFSQGSDTASTTFTVPQGQRLVIEFVSLDSVLPSGEKLVIADISTVLHNQHTEYHLTPVFTGTDVNGRPEFAADQDLRLYADGGTDVTVIGVTDTPAPNGFTGVIAGQVSGYLIDCLVAPCN